MTNWLLKAGRCVCDSITSKNPTDSNPALSHGRATRIYSLQLGRVSRSKVGR